MLASCKNKSLDIPFSVDTATITALSEGGVFDVELSSSQAWTATSDNPWISVSPANGPSSATCKVSIDSTVVNQARRGIVRFHNRVSGKNCDIEVVQDGYGYNISVLEASREIDYYASVDDRTFDVTLRTNVPFEVVIPDSAKKWLKYEVAEYTLDRGARPRDVKVTFTWGINSIPLQRTAEVEFKPKAGWSVLKADKLQVLQKAAPEITIGHEGDSIVVQSIARNMGLWYGVPTSDKMANWDIVKLWEEGDEGYTPEKEGRVRYAEFALFFTTEGIPFEVQYLTEAEELVFFSNINSFLHDLDVDEYICKLSQLKRLTISSYGLSSLPTEFAKLKNLEYLNLSGNNFASLPDVLTPENFPKLHALHLNTCQRYYVLDMSNETRTNLAGLEGPFPRRLLEWEKLDTLRLSVNYLSGQMPDMEDYPVRYTAQDCIEMNLPDGTKGEPNMIGKPKVLPNIKYFAFNLNRMWGELPEWVLIHPNLTDWGPYSLCYPQEGRSRDGVLCGFTNVPVNMDYYWKFYDGYKEHVDIYIGD